VTPLHLIAWIVLILAVAALVALAVWNRRHKN
jgi:hypothetical protein